MPGIWYRTGTIDVVNGSTEVTGNGTLWQDPKVGAQPGNMIFMPNGEPYEVAYVITNTKIILSTAYDGPTAPAQSYAIVTPLVGSVPALANKVASTLAFAQGQYETLDAWAHGGVDEDVEITNPNNGETTVIPSLAKLSKMTEKIGDALPAAIRAEAAEQKAQQHKTAAAASAASAAGSAASVGEDADRAEAAANEATTVKASVDAAAAAAEESKISAAGSASAASESATLSGQKAAEAVATENRISDAAAAQISSITAEGSKQVTAVGDKGSAEVAKVSAKGAEQVAAVSDKGSAEVARVVAAGSEQTSNAVAAAERSEAAAQRAEDLVDQATGGSLLKEQNLADVPDKAAARDNLGAVSASDVAAEIVGAALPFPDVWLPLNDSLRLLAGFGDEIKVGDYTVATQATLTRNSAATMVNKSLSLTPAAINEARFEREGVIIEPKRTNIIKIAESYNPNPQGGVTSVSKTQIMGFNFVKQVNDGTGNGSTITCSDTFDIKAGDTIVYQAVFKLPDSGEQAGRFRCRVGYSGGFAFDLSFYNELSNDKEPTNPTYKIEKTQPYLDKTLVRVVRTLVASADYTGCFLQLQSLQVAGVVNVGCHHAELATYATSYIPTNDSAVTRAADKLTIPRLNNDCAEWYSGPDQIHPIVTEDTIELVPPAGKVHLRNVRGFFTPLTPAQKAALK